MQMRSLIGNLMITAVAVMGLGAALYATGHWPAMQTPGGMSMPSAPPAAGVPPAANSTAPAVSVVEVEPADFVETVLITGSVIARDEILVAPEIEGFRIEDLAAEEGDNVKKGQLLARLNSDPIDSQLAKNDADVARAVAAIAVARSGIVQAQASLKEASNAFDRVKPLARSGYASAATFDQRESAASTAGAKLVSARDSLTSAEADKAAFEASRRDLTWRKSRTGVRAPVDGIVSRRTARVGGVASALNDPLFRIIARGELELDAEVAESDAGKIHDGQQAAISITGGIEVTGTVRLVSSEVDRATRLGKVKVFLGANPALRLGSFGRGTIETARSHGLAVPSSALVYTPDGATLLAVKDGHVEARPVKVGLKTPLLVEIIEGAAEGDIVVARSGSFLRHGDAVRPVVADTRLSGTGKASGDPR